MSSISINSYLSFAHLMGLLTIDKAALPALALLLFQVGDHLLLRGQLALSRVELEREAHLHIEYVRGYHIEGQSNERHCGIVDVDAVLPQWLHEVIDHLNAHIGAEAGKTILIPGAVDHVIKALLAAILKNGPLFRESFHVRLLRDIAHKGGVGRGREMMTQVHMPGLLANVICNVHATGTGTNNQHALIYRDRI